MASGPPALADEVPGWVHEAMSRAIPDSAAGAPAVVLEFENQVVVRSTGRVVERRRSAVRITSRQGAAAAQASIFYCSDGSKIRDLQGWLVDAGGHVTTLGSEHVIDRAMLADGLYDDYRIRTLSVVGEARPGSVFAYEWTCEQTTPFLQFEWAFQEERPVLRSRFLLELPEGWTEFSRTFNHEPLQPGWAGSDLVWELRNLPEVVDEPWRPDTRSIVPRIAVGALCPTGRRPSDAQVFRDWSGVARWLDGVSAAAGAPDDAVRRRALGLVANARSELDTLRALGGFVQSLLYASIQIGVSRGGGYVPGPPGQVLARGYGDCKDKANLMRALLAALQRPAFLVVLNAGDPTFVDAEWPTPTAFNHCIVAIPLRGGPRLAAEVRDPHYGRLLMFDPTDPTAPLGDLPSADQGGLALIMAPEVTGPLRLPELDPEASAVERRVDLVLDSEGGAEAGVVERCTGNSAALERQVLRALNRSDYRAAVEGWVHQAARGARVTRVEVRDDSLGAAFETRVSFSMANFAQVMQSRLMVVRPPLFSRLGSALAEDRPRHYPALLPRYVARETLTVHVPTGFRVDEMPDTVALETPFATFAAGSEHQANAVRLVRCLTVRETRVPAEQFHAVRSFYARVRSSEEAPVVFVREE